MALGLFRGKDRFQCRSAIPFFYWRKTEREEEKIAASDPTKLYNPSPALRHCTVPLEVRANLGMVVTHGSQLDPPSPRGCRTGRGARLSAAREPRAIPGPVRCDARLL